MWWAHMQHLTHLPIVQERCSVFVFVCVHANEDKNPAPLLPCIKKQAIFRNMSTDSRTEAYLYYRDSGRNLIDDVNTLLSNPRGVLVFTPELVVLMKPVLLQEELLWGELADNPADADAWYVHLLAGNVALARRLAATLPPLEWLCFQRGRRSNQPHIYRWEQLLLNNNN